MRKGGNNYTDDLYDDDYYEDDYEEEDYDLEEEIEKPKNTKPQKKSNKAYENYPSQKPNPKTNQNQIQNQNKNQNQNQNQNQNKTQNQTQNQNISIPKKTEKILSPSELNTLQYPKIDYTKKIEKDETERTDINIVIIGHVDSGKSTLIGHLLYLLKEISEKDIQNIKKQNKKSGKSQINYAWAADEREDERERGVTVDISYKNFKTKTKNIFAMDAPGHRDFIPNMITGTSLADAAILVIDSGKNSFDAGFFKNGQTKEHVILAKTLGVKQIICAVNKLELFNWSKERFDFIKNQLSSFLINVGFEENNIFFVPISALNGEGLIEHVKDHCNWYDGPCLIEAIDNLNNPLNENEAPVRFIINDSGNNSINGMNGITIFGKLECGMIFEKTDYLILPNNIKVKIKSINVNKEKSDFVNCGQQAELLLNLDKNTNEEIKQGSILCSVDYPVPYVNLFKSQIKTLDIKCPISIGQKLFLHLQGQKIQVTIKKILKIYNEDNSVEKKNTIFIPKNFYADVVLECENKIWVELFKNIKNLGRIALRAEGVTMAVGFVEEFL